jgi:hypothetical protein
MDEMREGDRDGRKNNRKWCSIHPPRPDRELEKYDFRAVENFVFLKESEGFVETRTEESCDELILLHHWSYRNVNLLVHRLEWII